MIWGTIVRAHYDVIVMCVLAFTNKNIFIARASIPYHDLEGVTFWKLSD